MRHRPIFDIERKILIPFLLLGVISTVMLGVILYDTNRGIKLTKEWNLAENNISLIEFDIDYSVRMSEVQQLREKYREIPQFHILIEDRDGTYIGGIPAGTGKVLYSSSDNQLGWKISYTVDQQVFTVELLHEQKYTILAIIAQLILMLQASILITDNISAPIRRLSHACHTVSEQPQELWDVDVESTNHGDELDQLARVFQGMLRNLQRYTADLRREKNLNQAVVESLPLAVIAYDQGQNIPLGNSRAQNLLAKTGYRHEGKPLSALLEECLENRKVFYDPIQLTDEENHRLDVELGVWRLMDESQKSWGVLCTVDDITYRKMMEEQAVQDEKLIYTGKLVAELAHEIRNPLTGIRVGVQVVEHHLTQDNDRVLCETIVGKVDRINLLVENLCSLNRGRELKKNLIPVDELFEEILLLYSKIAENSHISLRCKAPKDVLLYADKSTMKQVLINLINNSIKVMKSGGEILMKADAQEDCVCLWVIDDGSGITTERLGEGNRDGGMGLSIVSQLLRQNDAAFQIKSAPGQGTKVRITFHRQSGMWKKRNESMQSKILVIDDEYLIRISLREGLTDLGYLMQEAETIKEGPRLAEEFKPDVVMLDNRLGNVLGMEYIEIIKKLDEDIQIIIITAYSSISQAVQAVRCGAYNYVQKPFDTDAIDTVIRRALDQPKSHRKLKLLSSGRPPDLIGVSPQMQQIKRQVELLNTKDNVDFLVHGETGSDKGVAVAQIHQKSACRNFPLVKISCSATPENLFESELLGHEKGAFTGALARKKDLFELANEGTVFLDETGDMPLPTQAKLLTFLEDCKFRRVGGSSDVEVNVRVIAATNRPLGWAIEEKTFRADLFFRLNVVQLCLAPLCERPQDIEPLCQYYLDFFNQKLGKNIRQISPAFMQKLEEYFWKRDMRKLRNVLERAVLFRDGDVLKHTGQLLEESGTPQISVSQSGKLWLIQGLSNPIDLQKELERPEMAYIDKAFRLTGDNYSQAAKLLGYGRFSLRRRLE